MLASLSVKPTGKLAVLLDVDQELKRFEYRLAQMRKARPLGDSTAPTRVDVDALWVKWVSVKPDLRPFTKKELRALCWDRRAAGDESFLFAVRGDDYLAGNIRILRGLWHSHQRDWKMPTATTIERMLRKRATGPSAHASCLQRVWQEPALLSDSAPDALVRRVSTDWASVRMHLEQVGVTPEGQLGQKALQKMRDAWLDEVRKLRGDGDVDRLIRAGEKGLVVPDLTSPEQFRLVVQALMLQINGAGKPYRTSIARWIVEEPRLGHPVRLKTRSNWTGISDGAKKLAIQLFAARDLTLFFEVLIGAGADHQDRRPFWERYAYSPQLLDFAIASDPSDKQRLISKLGKDGGDVAKLTFAPESHSAFIMRFSGREDITIAEMSKANNAMYLFRTDNFEHAVGSIEKRAFQFSKLKDKANSIQHLSHSTYWHERFETTLRQYGIYPGTPQ